TLPRLALQDGTLIRWTLSRRDLDPFVRNYYLHAYLEALDLLRDQGIPLASYISRPRAPEVTGLVRLMADPEIDHNTYGGDQVDPCEGIVDQQLFQTMLAPGERGPLFVSM